MTPIIPLLVKAFVATAAPSEYIECSFTEPFFNTTYNFEDRTMKIEAIEGISKVIKDVTFQIDGAGSFSLIDSNGYIVQKLKLTWKGSDGMSDIIFPFEVRHHRAQDGVKDVIGGCSSANLPSSNNGDE